MSLRLVPQRKADFGRWSEAKAIITEGHAVDETARLLANWAEDLRRAGYEAGFRAAMDSFVDERTKR